MGATATLIAGFRGLRVKFGTEIKNGRVAGVLTAVGPDGRKNGQPHLRRILKHMEYACGNVF
ncbi:hypothetical protein HDR58_02035 [bacterium]|nr:hypothetical protein [bacterium]